MDSLHSVIPETDTSSALLISMIDRNECVQCLSTINRTHQALTRKLPAGQQNSLLLFPQTRPKVAKALLGSSMKALRKNGRFVHAPKLLPLLRDNLEEIPNSSCYIRFSSQGEVLTVETFKKSTTR